MKYAVEFSKEALKDLKKPEKPTAALILGWVRKNLEGTDDPRRHGKALTGNLGGRWRYRVGDYRLLARIDDGRVLILVLHVGRRREIYE